MTAPKLVTIGVPIYRRLEYLPSVLRMVGSQDYPSVELIVSDNGENGSKVQEIIRAEGYSRPYRFRQNRSTVNMIPHYNQIIAEATGEYFVTLNDDDEISSNFVTELVGQLQKHPEATLAFARQEIINTASEVIRKSKENLPVILSGPEFIRATWEKYEFGFENVESFMAKTKILQETGGYPDFTKGNHSDNAVAIRACLNHFVVFSSKCAYRHRVYEGSYCWQVSTKELGAACREFMRFLDQDPTIRTFAKAHPAEWQSLKIVLVRMSWQTYFWRWRDIYRHRMSGINWILAGFAMPFLPEYYRKIASALKNTAQSKLRRILTGQNEEEANFFEHGRQS